MFSETQEQIVQKAAHTAETVGSATAIGSGLAGWLTQHHEIIWFTGILVGAVVAIAGLFVQYHFKSKADSRQAERHKAEMALIKSQLDS